MVIWDLLNGIWRYTWLGICATAGHDWGLTEKEICEHHPFVRHSFLSESRARIQLHLPCANLHEPAGLDAHRFVVECHGNGVVPRHHGHEFRHTFLPGLVAV